MPFRIVFTDKQCAEVEEFELRAPREGEVERVEAEDDDARR